MRSTLRNPPRLSRLGLGKGMLLAPLVPIAIVLCTGRLDDAWFVIGSYPASMVAGIPTVLALELSGLRRLWHYVGAGFFLPCLACLALRWSGPFETGHAWLEVARYAVSLGALFAAESATLWCLAFRPHRG